MWPGRDSNGTRTEYKSRTLPLRQPGRRGLPKKLTVAQLVKALPALYATRRLSPCSQRPRWIESPSFSFIRELYRFSVKIQTTWNITFMAFMAPLRLHCILLAVTVAPRTFKWDVVCSFCCEAHERFRKATMRTFCVHRHKQKTFVVPPPHPRSEYVWSLASTPPIRLTHLMHR
jgi:hypothetical protein